MKRVPISTYRLQLSGECNFAAVRQNLDYLKQLQVSDLYFSPLFRSREGSSHGYDVVSHSEIEPSFGRREEFLSLVDEIRSRDMGILLDVVPNHMGINDSDNSWWVDVLANGPLSRYATYFDIDWERPDNKLRNKLLLPLLSDYFGSVLERGELQTSYADGNFQLAYGALRFPINAFSWNQILSPALELLDGAKYESQSVELKSIINQLSNLPGRELAEDAASQERVLEQRVAAQRITKLVGSSPAVNDAVQNVLAEINGIPGKASSFNRLESLLDAQWYRLAFWRVAADEINYRRFFDINDLAAIRVELPEVFAHVHELVFDLLKADRITGLRIDHPDGLFDPQLYLEGLQKLYGEVSPKGPITANSLYVVVEKILTGDEPLPASWPVAGTTGYELLNHLSQVLVDGDGIESLQQTYDQFVGERRLPGDVNYESKRQVLHDALASELNMLASRLHRLAQSSRHSRDFTFPSLMRALREIIACFPVYRTYIRSQGWEVDADDQGRIGNAIRLAKRRNPTMPRAVFDFISSVLRLEFPPTFEKSQQESWREFTLRFQQVTGPVTAKGIEDTAFYRHFPLASLNEVGGEIGLPKLSVAQFHALMQRRFASWPHGLSATGTHDTKRGEDFRARLLVLSEIPNEWNDYALAWDQKIEGLKREVDGRLVPDSNERFLLLQTLVGTWHHDRSDPIQLKEYGERIVEYMTKAMREAKRNTSWLDPSPEYERAVFDFVREFLDESRSLELLLDMDQFVERIADAGFLNSLSQLVLKATLPGVPDFYQGTELWDFNLVDPDNRRSVDFVERHRLLAALQADFEADSDSLVNQLANFWPDSRIKLFTTWRLLWMRQSHPDLFAKGDYVPLEVRGRNAEHVIAFARVLDDQFAMIVVPRRTYTLLPLEESTLVATSKLPAIDWADTEVELPEAMGLSAVNIITQHDCSFDCTKRAALSSLLPLLPFSVHLSSNASEKI